MKIRCSKMPLVCAEVTTAASVCRILLMRLFAVLMPAVELRLPRSQCDLAAEEIPADGYHSAAATHATPSFTSWQRRAVDAALRLIGAAQRPAMYVGQGVRGAADTVMTLARKLQMPVMTAVGKPIIPYEFESLLGSAAPVASKPANEALRVADLIAFVGSNYPFAGKSCSHRTQVYSDRGRSEDIGQAPSHRCCHFGGCSGNLEEND